jgi:hypothetical protein
VGDETLETMIRLMEASVWITGALSGYCKRVKRNNPITTAETEEVTKLLKIRSMNFRLSLNNEKTGFKKQ